MSTVTARRTAAGAVAANLTPEQQMSRTLMTCMLWENNAHDSGEDVATRIKALVPQVDGETLLGMAIEARNQMKLRHAPLLLVREMARHPHTRRFVRQAVSQVVQRADELAEFLSLYWLDNPSAPIAAQVKLGLADAFKKFNAYQLAKYNRDKPVKLRDVMFMTHPKPPEGLEEVWQKLADQELESPDTWEVALSGGANKKETFTRLLQENKLGAMALLRNLRNMIDAGVDESLIVQGLDSMKAERVLPFRFLTAFKYAPKLKAQIERAMFRCLDGIEKIPGKTVLIVDLSSSMGSAVSSKSELQRVDAAISIAMLGAEMFQDARIYATAGDDMRRRHATALVKQARGFALREAIAKTAPSIGCGGIFLKQCMDYVYDKEKTADRVIVFTDEVDCDDKCNPDTANAFGARNYLVNIASEANGVGYGKWVHIDGFSEATLQYVAAFESFAR